MIYDWFNDLARVLRVNIMAYDYSGYGKSNGYPCEEYVYADIEAAYQYLLQVKKISPESIVLYGRSLGSGPSCYLASKTAKEGRSVAGVILQSPLLSAFRVAFNFRFTMVWDKFPNIDYAPHIRCPVFIVHGTQDEVVPFYHGQDLFLSLKQCWRAKPFWVVGAGHNNIEALLRPSGAFVDRLVEFLDIHISARKGDPREPRPVPECLERLSHEKYTGKGYSDSFGMHSGFGAISASCGSHGTDGDSFNGSQRKSVVRDSPWGATVTSTAKVMGKVDNIAQQV